MAVRINGVAHRSGCDINILMESRDLRERLDTPAAREARIQKYAERFANGLPIFDDEAPADEDLTLISVEE